METVFNDALLWMMIVMFAFVELTLFCVIRSIGKLQKETRELMSNIWKVLAAEFLRKYSNDN